MLYLLPLSLDEVQRFDSPPRDLWETLWTGGYPRIHDRGLDAGEWLADYVATYVQRDVRQVLNVTDLDAFTTFVRLVAARTGQELNLSSLGGDAGVSHNTVRAWLSVLEPLPRLLYGGDRRETRGGVEVIPWTEVQSVVW
ncbi:MAG: hypothetical protein L0271_11190 [Gemmatimonadetes bacterium]|nr:hypothetical protein [Gemmatimonadota bacterium]